MNCVAFILLLPSIGQTIASQWITRTSANIIQAQESPSDVVQNFIEHGRKHPDGTAAFSIDMADRGGGKSAVGRKVEEEEEEQHPQQQRKNKKRTR